MKKQASDFQDLNSESHIELATWQKALLDVRLNEYYQNPDVVLDFDEMIRDLEKTLQIKVSPLANGGDLEGAYP